MSALAYSTDRAGCVSHPTPTRRCTHVGPGGPILTTISLDFDDGHGQNLEYLTTDIVR